MASISSNKLGDNKPDTLVVAKGITALVPSEETIVLAPVVPVILKSVDTLWLISLTFKVFATISSNFAFVNKPALVVEADTKVALVPSLEFTSTVVSVEVPSDKSVDTLWLISLTLAVLASISSNNPGDNRPETLVVAKGITAFVPSDDVIVLAPVVPVIPKSVLTFDTLAVFAVIADAWSVVIVVVLPASAVDELVPNCKVVTEPPSEIAEPSIVIDDDAKSLFCIVPNVIACPLIDK